ncbi:endonuclease domain-containing protein [Allosphingosinicella flava]|nr:endonuclease domain-containing protein [Sphingosinicella flava]
MRRAPTEPEQRLWLALRAGRLTGAKFRRQVVIGPYIADFACRLPSQLVIEIDGNTHADQAAYDQARTQYLEAQGYCVLRFTNADIMTNLEGVLQASTQALTPPLPNLSPEGERG